MVQAIDMPYDEAVPIEQNMWVFKAHPTATAQATVDAKRWVRDQHDISFNELVATTLHSVEGEYDRDRGEFTDGYRIIVVAEKPTQGEL